MRIIRGEARGRPIRLPRECRIRPTADRVKKSLFDILDPVAGKSFLDLFAGSGNVGLEALSRGARFSAFVEKDTRLVRIIRMAISRLGFMERAEVVGTDVQRGLAYLSRRKARFNILFADPPYDECWVRRTLCWMKENNVLADHGLVVIQHSVREKPESSKVDPFVIVDQKRYGDTLLSFYHQNKIEEESYEKDSGLSGLI